MLLHVGFSLSLAQVRRVHLRLREFRARLVPRVLERNSNLPLREARRKILLHCERMTFSSAGTLTAAFSRSLSRRCGTIISLEKALLE